MKKNKKQLQSYGPGPLGAPQQSLAYPTTRPGRLKRAKHARRRKSSRSIATRIFPDGDITPDPADPYGCTSTGSRGIREASYFPSPEDGACNHKSGSASTTVIRQRIEKQAEQAEVSLEGLWLPSLPSPSSNTADTSAYSRGGRWADPSPCSTTAISSRECGGIVPLAPGMDGCRTRPATVATQGPSSNKGMARAATSGVALRGGAATAGAGAARRMRNVDTIASRTSQTTDRVGSRRFHEADEAQGNNERDDFEVPEDSEPQTALATTRGVCEQTFALDYADNGGGHETSASDPVAARLITGREGDEEYRNDARAAMSQHTVAMLERSRMLVAKAKVGWRNVV